MLYFALLFFLIAIVAGVLGFNVLAATAATVAQVLFWAFLLFALGTSIAYILRRPK